MHQIWADKYAQETVIKRTICCLLTMQLYSDSVLIFFYRVNDIAFYFKVVLCCKLDFFFFNLLFGFWEEIIEEEKYQKPAFF